MKAIPKEPPELAHHVVEGDALGHVVGREAGDGELGEREWRSG
jgi:hypothetical protein